MDHPKPLRPPPWQMPTEAEMAAYRAALVILPLGADPAQVVAAFGPGTWTTETSPPPGRVVFAPDSWREGLDRAERSQ